VSQQVKTIISVAEDLKAFLERRQAEQQRKAIQRFTHALNSGDRDDKELDDMLRQLGSAKDELVLRITLTQVGLLGNIKDGFSVVVNQLIETNKKVNETLGKELVLAQHVRERRPQQNGGFQS
jgi:hypothetical protein